MGVYMTTTPKNPPRQAGKASQRAHLRLVSQEVLTSSDADIQSEKVAETAAPKSSIGKFMDAYADAIERQIQAILDS
jgi:hypothetical protein